MRALTQIRTMAFWLRATLTLVPSLVTITSSASDSVLPPLESLASRVDSLTACAVYAQADSLAVGALRQAQDHYAAHDPRLGVWFLRSGLVRLELGRLEEAAGMFQQALTVAATHGTEGSSAVLDAMRGLHRTRLEQEVLPEAAELAERCLDLSRELYGRQDARVAEDLCNLARVRLEQDRLEETTELLSEARRLVEEHGDAEHETYGDILCLQGLVANSAGRFEEAIALHQESLASLERTRGADHPAVTAPMTGLAVANKRLGRFETAEALYRRCLDIRERTCGPNHPGVALALNDLGIVLYLKGAYEEALTAYQQCIAIRSTTDSGPGAEAAITMINLAGLLSDLGRYAETIRLRRQALAILEEVRGPDHTLTAYALNSLAWSLRRRGSSGEAEALFRRALTIVENKHDFPHHEAAVRKRQIGLCLMDQGELLAAEEYLTAAIAEATAIYGADDYHVARHERELGILFLRQGKPAEALPVLQRSLSVLADQYGSDHLVLQPCCEGLTVANLMQGRVEAAREYADRSLATAEIAAGEGNRDLVKSLLLMVMVESAANRWEAAVQQGFRACETALEIQEDIFRVSSEHDAIVYASLPRRTVEELLTVARFLPDPPDSILARLFTLVARTHGQVLDRMAQRGQYSELAASSSETGQRFQDFSTAAQQLADLIVSGPQRSREHYFQAVARARQQKEDAERALVETCERFRAENEIRQRQDRISLATLAGALPPDATLIHFVRFPSLPTTATQWALGETPGSDRSPSGAPERYGAFRLRLADHSVSAPELQFVDLGAATSLDSLVAVYRQTVTSIHQGERPSTRDEVEYRTVASQLYERLWSPLFPRSDGENPPAGSTGAAVRIFIVPASHLYWVDFNTLLTPQGGLVIEKWRVHCQSSARDLLRYSLAPPATGGRGLLVAGNPVWSREPDLIEADKDPAGPHPLTFLCRDTKQSLGNLPGAEAEVRVVADLYSRATTEPITLLLGAEATEEAVKRSLAGKRLVHLATHGYYCDPSVPENRGSDEVSRNPLLLSGLILGASEGGDDGLLTAMEIVSCDLRGLDAVILSACNSGLGRLLPGEGMLGLRRAFEMAGVGTVVMTLWRVHDVATRDLMERVYRHNLAGVPIADAVRLAQLERLADQRQRLHRIHPALWGGVVAEGDWR
ncbi:MAG: tetratricopeptide repeat protein [bacterium]